MNVGIATTPKRRTVERPVFTPHAGGWINEGVLRDFLAWRAAVAAKARLS